MDSICNPAIKLRTLLAGARVAYGIGKLFLSTWSLKGKDMNRTRTDIILPNN